MKKIFALRTIYSPISKKNMFCILYSILVMIKLVSLQIIIFYSILLKNFDFFLLQMVNIYRTMGYM